MSTRPWGSIKESDYEDAEDFCGACLIDLNKPGEDKVKARCKLPVYEPKKMGRALNRNAVVAAAAALAGARGGVKAPPEAKRKVARTLVRLYRRELKEDPPESILRIAGMR